MGASGHMTVGFVTWAGTNPQAGSGDAVEDVLRLVGALMAGGETPEYAWRMARGNYPADVVGEAEAHLRERQASIVELPEPLVVQRPDVIEPWYTGPLPGHVIWPATRSAILADGFPEPAMNEDVDPASTRILNHLPPPGEPEIQARGLVLGFVQSGKTTSYTSLIAKAADAGYRLVVVLAGIHDALREQTQERLDSYLVEASGGQWMNVTHDGDFANPLPMEQILTPAGSRALAVVKKNPHRLRRLVRWLDEAPEELLRNRPVLVIDDEADQASINVGSGRRSTINRLILRLLDRPKAAYVAYTATPFANMLIDPDADDLYPDDFIAALPRPEDYFGPEKLFGRQPLSEDDADDDIDGLGVVRHVDDHEASELRPPTKRDHRASWTPTVPPPLREAVSWFLLATAARRARGQAGHSSMLVHTTMYTDAHEALARPIRDLLRGWSSRDPATEEEFRDVWERLHRPDLTAQFDLAPLEFKDIGPALDAVLGNVRVIVDNYRSEERLSYPEGRDINVIAIGGNTLSRGLTLEGLVTSFFIRAASAYDTLMQMGRWFGFRRGYADLPRVWMTPDLEDFFIRMATVEAEVRADVERYRFEHKTPRDFAVRIRTTPGLAVTSRAKMRSGVTVRVSYAGQRLQTIIFNHRSAEELRGNITATRRLVSAAVSAGALFRPRDGRDGWWLARDVPWENVRRFIASYRFHPEAAELNSEAIIRFVDRQTDLGGITTWNVVIAGLPQPEHGSLDLGLPADIGLIVRSKMNIRGIPHANIKSLMSTVDRTADLPDLDPQLAEIMQERGGARGTREGKIAALRPEGVALLIIYPIQARSSPRNSGPKSQRTDLDAVDDVVGVGLVFPPCSRTEYEAVEYVVAFTEPRDLEDADELSEQEAQLADAHDAETLAREDSAAEEQP